MSNLDDYIIKTDKEVKELMKEGYSRAEALQMVQAVAMTRLANAVTGNMATYEQ